MQGRGGRRGEFVSRPRARARARARRWLEGLSSLPIGRIDRLNRNKRDHRLVVARESGRAKVPIPISQKRSFVLVSAIRRVSRTESDRNVRDRPCSQCGLPAVTQSSCCEQSGNLVNNYAAFCSPVFPFMMAKCFELTRQRPSMRAEGERGRWVS